MQVPHGSPSIMRCVHACILFSLPSTVVSFFNVCDGGSYIEKWKTFSRNTASVIGLHHSLPVYHNSANMLECALLH